MNRRILAVDRIREYASTVWINFPELVGIALFMIYLGYVILLWNP